MLRLLRQDRVHHRRCRNRGGTRVMTETALLCGWLERQIRLRRNPPLCFLQPQLPQCDIGRDATFIEKAAPQGSQSDTKPLRQIAFAEHRQPLAQRIHRRRCGDLYKRMNGMALRGAHISQSAPGTSGVASSFSSSTGRASRMPPFMVTREGGSNHRAYLIPCNQLHDSQPGVAQPCGTGLSCRRNHIYSPHPWRR